MRIALGIVILVSAIYADTAFMIEGYVVSGQGRPVKDADVLVLELPLLELPLGRSELARTRSDAEGRFSVAVPRNVAEAREQPFGPAQLVVRAAAYSRYRDTVFAGERNLRVMVAKPQSIRGRVSDTAGAPVAGVVVEVGAALAETGSDGAFVLHDAAAGTEWISISGAEVKPTRVRIPPRGDVDARVERMAYGTFMGRVTCAATGEPVAGATVTRWHGPPATTDAQGRFTIRLLRKETSLGGAGVLPAETSLEVLAPGYCVERLHVSEGALLDCALERMPPIYGRVSDGKGAPVSHAEVTLRTDHPIGGGYAPLTSLTDAEGRFRLDNAPREPFRYVTRARGFLETESASPEIHLLPGLRAAGRVVDELGRPVVGARIDLRTMTGVGYSDDEGRFAVSGLPGNAGPLRARRGDRWSAFVPIEDVGDLVLKDRLPVTGVLVDDLGEPVADCEVRCTGQSVDRVTKTDATGRFCIDGLPLGYYHVSANPEGHVDLRRGAWAGETLRLVSERLLGDCTLDIHLPAACGRVRVWIERGRLRRNAVEDAAEGVVTFDDLIPGSYKVSVDAVGFEPHAADVEVRGRTRLDVELVRGQPIEIETWPMAQIDILTLGGREAPPHAEADASGSARVYGANGSYLLVARKPGQLLAIAELETAENRPKLELRAGEAAHLAVRVLDGAGAPVGGARFVLVTTGGCQVPVQGETDAAGRATLWELAAGDILIRALHGGREGEVRLTVTPRAKLAAVIRLGSADTTIEVD